MADVTKKDFEEFKGEVKDMIRHETVQSIMSIEEARQTAKIFIEAKKLNLVQMVKDAVDKTVNGKLEKLSKQIENMVSVERGWHQKHELYHQKNEKNWGIIERISQNWKKSPIKTTLSFIIVLILPSVIYIKESRDFLITQAVNLLYKLF